RQATLPKPPPVPAPAPPAPPSASPPDMTTTASSLSVEGAIVVVPTDVPVADASAVTVVRPPSEKEMKALSAPPRQEERVPGAASTLPANPLSELDAAELASFVEHTLLETEVAADAAAIDVESGAIVIDDARAGEDPGRVAPPAPAARVETGLDRTRRIARR